MITKDPERVADFFWNRHSYCEEQIRYYISKYSKNLTMTFWITISQAQHLSEDFIREFKDKVHWSDISISQHLSEQFIREFKDKVHWYLIVKYQNLSEEFLIEFIENVNIDYLEENCRIPEEVIERILNLKKVIDQ